MSLKTRDLRLRVLYFLPYSYLLINFENLACFIKQAFFDICWLKRSPYLPKTNVTITYLQAVTEAEYLFARHCFTAITSE